MISITADPLNGLDYLNFKADEKDYKSSHLTKVATSRQQSTDLTIVTAEGDKVTLSYDSEFQATYVTYDSMARVNGQFASFKGEIFDFHASREFSLTVEGDLNKQEMIDIKKAIKAIGKIMRDFLFGDKDRAMARANRIGNLETISSVDASMQFEQTVYVERQLRTEATFPVPELEKDTGPIGDTPIPADVDKLTDKIAKVIEDSRIRPKKMSRHLHRLFRQLLKELSHEEPDDSPRHRIAKLIKARVLEKIEQLAQKE